MRRFGPNLFSVCRHHSLCLGSACPSHFLHPFQATRFSEHFLVSSIWHFNKVGLSSRKRQTKKQKRKINIDDSSAIHQERGTANARELKLNMKQFLLNLNKLIGCGAGGPECHENSSKWFSVDSHHGFFSRKTQWKWLWERGIAGKINRNQRSGIDIKTKTEAYTECRREKKREGQIKGEWGRRWKSFSKCETWNARKPHRIFFDWQLTHLQRENCRKFINANDKNIRLPSFSSHSGVRVDVDVRRATFSQKKNFFDSFLSLNPFPFFLRRNINQSTV